jgi:hypothetical protein
MKLRIGRDVRFGTGIALGLLIVALKVCAEERLTVLKVGNDVFSNVTVVAVSPTDIYFTHPGGMANAKLKELTPELQQHFHYNTTNAMAVEKNQMEANAQYHAWLVSHPAPSPPNEDRPVLSPAAADFLRQHGGNVCANPPPRAIHKGSALASFANHPLFAKDGPSKNDIFQGHVTDCYFMSRLAALADANPDYIKNTVADLSDGTYVVRFFKPNGEKTFIRVNAELWVDNSNALVYAQLGRQGCIWVPIVEKAFAICRLNKAGYDSLEISTRGNNNLVWKHTVIKIDAPGVNPDDVINWANSGEPEGQMKDTLCARVQKFLGQIYAQRQLGKAMVLGGPPGFYNKTPLVPPSAGLEKSTYRREQHVYLIDKVKMDAEGNFTGIVVRNPCGGYFTITDYARIFFCISWAGTEEPQTDLVAFSDW